MELTKEQIIFIDKYLKQNGVNYWDFRLEMIDHVASKIEENDIVLSEDFLNNEFGPYSQIKRTAREKCKLVNKKYRKEYFLEIKKFFKSYKNITVLLISLFTNYMLYKNLDYTFFKKLNFWGVGLTVLVTLSFYFKNFLQKNKSINLEYASFYFSFALLMFFYLIQFTNPNGIFNSSVKTQAIAILFFTPLVSVLTYCGFRVYKKAAKKYVEIFKQLNSI